MTVKLIGEATHISCDIPAFVRAEPKRGQVYQCDCGRRYVVKDFSIGDSFDGAKWSKGWYLFTKPYFGEVKCWEPAKNVSNEEMMLACVEQELKID